MKANATGAETSQRGPRAPHPVLDRYYATEIDRQPFVLDLFDGAAQYYNLVCATLALGSGQWYRRRALARSGLCAGMELLDVAVGTGLVARAAMDVLHDPASVIGLDPSSGMLGVARKTLAIALVRGTAEKLPFGNERFDFLSMGYALRHVADMGMSFRECGRVLKPGGRILILEISRPRSRVGQTLIRIYFQTILPLVMRMFTKSGYARLLTTYYWDTIAECVEPDTILEVLGASGFDRVERRVYGGVFSEYIGSKATG